MKHDPKKDTSFQNALQEILKSVVPFTPVAFEAPKLDLPPPEISEPDALKVKVLQKEGVWVSVEKFTDLRIRWFWAHCFPQDHEKGVVETARQAYCAVRDTPEAQRFLKENPASFERLHHALCQAAVSLQKQKRRLVT